MEDKELLEKYKEIGTPEDITRAIDGISEIMDRLVKLGTIEEIEEKVFRLEGLEK